MDMQNLMPPIDLVAANGIGMMEREDQEKAKTQFHNIGHGLIREMQHFGFISPSDDVLDVGCGLGRLARPLIDRLDEGGSYVGMDVVKSSINWCADAYGAYPNFRFVHSDVFNTHYNPEATTPASEYQFPFGDETFDFAWSTSLFTHTMIDTVDNYLGQIARVLRPGGSTWNTWFLLDEVSEPLATKPGGKMIPLWVLHPVDGGLVSNKDNPEHVIALYKDRILALHEKHGLEVVSVRYGPWSGRSEDLTASYQDVVIATKP